MAATGTVDVVPSGNVTLTEVPGSPVPDTFNVPSGLTVVTSVGATGGVVSA